MLVLLLIAIQLSYYISASWHVGIDSNATFWGSEYPDVVPEYKVRLDKASDEEVTAGRIHIMSSLASGKKEETYSFEEFKRILQCAPDEPGLNGRRGTIDLLKLVPPTADTVELMCAWAETNCSPWSECKKRVKQDESRKW